MQTQSTTYSPKVFADIREQIGIAIQRDDIATKTSLSNIEANIASFAPSCMTKNCAVSDFPFVGGAYYSVTDGDIYMVCPPLSNDDEGVVAVYGGGLSWACNAILGGRNTWSDAVSISKNAWMECRMILVSLPAPDIHFVEGVAEFGSKERRRLYLSRFVKAITQRSIDRLQAFAR